MDRALQTLRVGPGRSSAAAVARVSDALRRALDGTGPALAPLPAAPDDSPTGPHDGALPERVPDEVALVVRTSGSTGRPRHVLLGRSALAASAGATHARLGGPARWLLALPLDHVAGLQVVVRSLLGRGEAPVVVPEPADPDALAAAVRAAGGGAPLVTSLVPTQLRRVTESATPTLEALRALDAILVGGAATSPALLDRARDLGLRVVTTYGMTETCGGCVYDGVPLDGVDVRLDDGAVLLAGPVLALGYLDDPAAEAAAFPVLDGRRWHRTADVGELEDGHLRVLGRADDVVVTGGVKVAPAAVEAALAGLAAEVCVVGVPDAEWGEAVVVVLVPGAERVTLERVRAVVRRTLGPAAAPRHLVEVDALPLRGPGKVDRVAVARTAARALSGTTRH